MEWLGDCCHQSGPMSTCSGPLTTPVAGSTGIRDSRPCTTQPLVVGPGPFGGPGQASFHWGGVCPGAAS
jgi:hypothetical protein